MCVRMCLFMHVYLSMFLRLLLLLLPISIEFSDNSGGCCNIKRNAIEIEIECQHDNNTKKSTHSKNKTK